MLYIVSMVVGVVFFAAFLILGNAANRRSKSEDVTARQADEARIAKLWLRVLAGVTILGMGLTTLFCSLTSVASNSVGIQTQFGKYSGTLDSGLQLAAPWASTEQFSKRVQYLDLDKEHAVSVTFKGGGGGTVKATPRWRIDPAKAGALWRKFRSFEHVRDQLVSSSAKDSIRVIASQYTPNEARSGENLRKIDAEIKADLGQALAEDGIIIDSISVKGIPLDARSQASLDKIVAANNDVERAKAEQLRAKIDAETAEIRQRGGSLTGPALQRYCLEVVNNWDVGKNGPLPAGFSCFDTGQLQKVLPVK